MEEILDAQWKANPVSRITLNGHPWWRFFFSAKTFPAIIDVHVT